MQAQTIISIAVLIILSIAAIKTVIPNEQASKPCRLGYKAACSFTPISTAILVLAGICTFVIARRFIFG